VARSRVTGAMNLDQSIERCVLDSIDSIVFPAPNEGGHVWVTYPYILIPEGSDPGRVFRARERL
ncbi:MAG: hypothetical protein WBV82_20070, partial [Myxococcaceae bacterium]